ncbi:MAG: hypothetical protein ABI091_31985 [Ferruginibacter sp.]
MTINKRFLFFCFLLSSIAIQAQTTVPLPPFLKWQTNSSPGCKNVWVTKDSIVLAVKNKCVTEGTLTNWRPNAGVTADMLNFKVPAGTGIQLTITYKFKPVGNDVLSFYGSYDPESDNSDIAFSRSLRMKDKTVTLTATDEYKKAVFLVNFSEENDNPIWNATMLLKGSMNFDFNVTTTGDETNQGSIAVIKNVKLELVKL